MKQLIDYIGNAVKKDVDDYMTPVMMDRLSYHMYIKAKPMITKNRYKPKHHKRFTPRDYNLDVSTYVFKPSLNVLMRIAKWRKEGVSHSDIEQDEYDC